MKHRRILRAVSALSASALCCAAFLVPNKVNTISADSAQIKAYEDRIAQLDREQKELLDKINSIDREAAATLENKKYLDSLIENIMTKISAAERLSAELDAQIADTEAEIAQREKDIEESGERIKERVRQHHEDGKVNYLEVLLGSNGIGDFLSRLESINTVIEYDRNTLEDYKADKIKLKEDIKNLAASKELQKNTLEVLKNDRAELERKSAESAAYFDSLKNDKAAAKELYDKAEASKAQFDREIEELMRMAAAAPAPTAPPSPSDSPSAPQIPSGKFMWPLPPGQGYISCNYGDTDPWNKMHWATDIAIAAGTPVYAAADAVVVRATYHDSYGNYVLLDHGEKNSTLYAHFSAIAVSQGQSVKKGQVIGYVGNTGDSKGNHLHLEFRVNGKKVNALNYIPKGC